MLLAPRANAACVGYGKDILCAGGFNTGASHNNLWLYEHHQWQELDEHYPHTLPYCLEKSAVASVNNTFYFMGGASNATPPDEMSTRTRKKSENTKHVTLAVPKETSSPNGNKNNDNNKNSNSNSSSGSSNAKSTSNGNTYYYSNGKNGRNPHVKGIKNNPQGHVPKGKSKVKDAADPVPFKPNFHTERRTFSFTTAIQAGEETESMFQLDLISPWNLKLPPMIHARHSAGAVAIGHKIHVVGGTCIETGRPVKVSEHLNLITGEWEEDFTLRRCDVSNVTCVLVDVPKVPFIERKNTYRLRWVMW